MGKAGFDRSKTSGTQDIVRIGESQGYNPSLAVAKYLALVGLQKKTQADDLFGGYGNAKNLGSGFFGYDPFEGLREGDQAQSAKAPAPEETVMPANPPGGTVPPGTTPPPGTPPPTPNPPGGGGGGGGGGGTPGPGGTGGPPEPRPPRRAPMTRNTDMVGSAAYPGQIPPDELQRQFAAAQARLRGGA